MTTGLFVRYQELIGLLECEANKDGIDAHVPHVDVLVPMEEFVSSYVDSVQAEHLLNTAGHWTDNGYTENEHPLLQRVYKIVSDVNYEAEKAKLRVDAEGLDRWFNPA
jgi:hypothetical protein